MRSSPFFFSHFSFISFLTTPSKITMKFLANFFLFLLVAAPIASGNSPVAPPPDEGKGKGESPVASPVYEGKGKGESPVYDGKGKGDSPVASPSGKGKGKGKGKGTEPWFLCIYDQHSQVV
jgi:hypothetical protein